MKKCVGDVEAFTNPQHIKELKKSKVEEEMLDAYDLNHDDKINWAEFNIANLTLKKELPHARQIFRFFDKNHNWIIEKKELQKVKVSQLQTYISSKGKRRK